MTDRAATLAPAAALINALTGASVPIFAPPRGGPESRNAYKVFRDVGTRWLDNDVYGHVNNAVYYGWFDTAVNAYLIERGALDIHDGPTVGLVVESGCSYHTPVAFPQVVEAGLRVAHVGRTSVRYEIGLFVRGEPLTAARGHFIHVYVDKASRRPHALSASLKSALEFLQ